MEVARTPPRWSTWTAAVGIAEGLGILAAATVAVLAAGVTAGWTRAPAAAGALAAAVLGGVAEGTLVGTVQSTLLRRWLPGLSARRWVVATVAVVVALWLLGTLPSALMAAVGSTDAGAGGAAPEGPPMLVLLLVGFVGGALGGAAMGAVQSGVLRGHVTHPRRWITVNALAWSLGLLVILLAATLPTQDTPRGVVAVLAAGGGLLAGLVVGAVTGWALPGLDVDAPRAKTRRDRVVLEVLRSPAHVLLSGRLLELRYRGRRTGTWHALPVEYAPAEHGSLVVLVAGSAGKRWWRSIGERNEILVVHRGRTRVATARLARAGHPDHALALAAYRERFPRAQPSVFDPLVVVHPHGRPLESVGGPSAVRRRQAMA